LGVFRVGDQNDATGPRPLRCIASFGIHLAAPRAPLAPPQVPAQPAVGFFLERDEAAGHAGNAQHARKRQAGMAMQPDQQKAHAAA